MDAVAVACLFAAQLFLIFDRKLVGLVLCLIGSSLWLWIGISMQAAPLAIQSAVFALIAIWGIWRSR